MSRPGSHLGAWIIGGGVIGVRVQGCVEISPTYAAEAYRHRSFRALVTLNLECLSSIVKPREISRGEFQSTDA